LQRQLGAKVVTGAEIAAQKLPTAIVGWGQSPNLPGSALWGS